MVFLTKPISKTEILLETAVRLRDSRNIFFLNTSGRSNLNQAFLEIAEDIGHDLLLGRAGYNFHELHSIWTTFSKSQRIQAFTEATKRLSSEENGGCLLLLDDIDGIKDRQNLQQDMPRDAKIILCSTRDPSLAKALGDIEPVPPLNITDMSALIDAELHLNDLEVEPEKVRALAKVLDGHPVAGLRAVPYISLELSHVHGDAAVDVFLQSFDGDQWEVRNDFLTYRPAIGLSVMQTFEISINRLNPERTAGVHQLLEAIVFLSAPDSDLDFRTFLSIERPWLAGLSADLPDSEFFASGLSGKAADLGALENVSLGSRKTRKDPLRLHRLWLECIRQRSRHEGRLNWLRQVLLLCYHSWIRNKDRPLVGPFVKNCINIARSFRISYKELSQPPVSQSWILEAGGAESVPADAVEVEVEAVEAGIIRAVTQLKNDFEEATEELPQHCLYEHVEKARDVFLRLCMRINALEQSYPNLCFKPSIARIHLQTYDAFMAAAPKLANPLLAQSLPNRRSRYVVH